MKTISITYNNRLEYMEQLFSSLKKVENLSFFNLIYIKSEPMTRKGKFIYNLVKNFPIKIEIEENKIQLGIKKNPYSAVKNAFEKYNSEFNLNLEEDIILSPDAFNYCQWFYELKENPYFTCQLFNFDSKEKVFSEEDYFIVSPQMKFSALGWATFQKQWKDIFSKEWFKEYPPYGWEYSINEAIKKNKLFSLIPKVSRSYHTGLLGGIHYRRENHDKLYVNIIYNKEKKITNFRIKNESK
jgi:hypothetical protein